MAIGNIPNSGSLLVEGYRNSRRRLMFFFQNATRVMIMATDRNPDARARAAGAGNAMGYVIGAAVVAAVFAMLMFWAFGDRTLTGPTPTSPPPTTVPGTQPRASTPPTNPAPITEVVIAQPQRQRDRLPRMFRRWLSAGH